MKAVLLTLADEAIESGAFWVSKANWAEDAQDHKHAAECWNAAAAAFYASEKASAAAAEYSREQREAQETADASNS